MIVFLVLNSGAFFIASAIVFTVPFPSFETTISACNTPTGNVSNRLSLRLIHPGKLPESSSFSAAFIKRRLFWIGTPEKSFLTLPENNARQLLTSSDKSWSLSVIWSLTLPLSWENPSVQVSWLVRAALSQVMTSSEEEARGCGRLSEEGGAREWKERVRAWTESSRSSRQAS